MTHTIESLLALTVDVGGCREWRGATKHGVPFARHDGGEWYVRRLIAHLAGVELLPGHVLTTTCGNRLCIEPAHAVQVSRHAPKKRIADVAAPVPRRPDVAMGPWAGLGGR